MIQKTKNLPRGKKSSGLLHKKLKAVTIMELVVVLFLSSILVTFSYYGYQKLHEHFYFLKSATKDIYNRELAHTIIGAEIEKSLYVTSERNKIQLTDASGNKQNFEFYEDKVIRNMASRQDTFGFKGFSEITFRHFKNVTLGPDSLATSIAIEYDDGSGLQMMHWEKQYSAADIINLR